LELLLPGWVDVADFDAGGTSGEGEGCDQHAIWFGAAGVSGLCALAMCDYSPLLRLKYHDSIADAVKELGKPEEIGQVFSRFQKYLYQQVP